MNRSLVITAAFSGLAQFAAAAAHAAEPAAPPDEVAALAAAIDRHIEARWADEDVTPAPRADDAEFHRRTWLDLVGRIPPAMDVREFLADTAPDKRRRLVERLLDSPGYVNHFTDTWRKVLLPEASADFRVALLQPMFEAWLREKLAANTRYDRLVHELLTAPIDENVRRGLFRQGTTPTPAAFYQAKEIKPENLAAATSRMFLGIRLECAQCHDHPLDSWTQREFWGLAAFFAGLERSEPAQGVFGNITELFDRREIAIPETGEVVQAAFLDGSDVVLRFNTGTRETLADWVTSPRNRYFSRTAANRLWAHFLGLGLVDPVDDFGAVNEPSHPELLGELAGALVAHEFDLKFLMRAIIASRAYQLTSRQTHESQGDPRLFARMSVKGLTPEQLFASLAQAIGEPVPFESRLAFRFSRTPQSELMELFANEAEAPTRQSTTILQALALMNGRLVAGATSLDESRTLAAVIDFPFTTTERIEALYLATLSRPPRPGELDRLTAWVGRGGTTDETNQALADVFWALLNSSEFVVNH